MLFPTVPNNIGQVIVKSALEQCHMWTEQGELNMNKGGQTRCEREDRVYVAGGEEDAWHFQRGGRKDKGLLDYGGKQSSEEFHADY